MVIYIFLKNVLCIYKVFNSMSGKDDCGIIYIFKEFIGDYEICKIRGIWDA